MRFAEIIFSLLWATLTLQSSIPKKHLKIVTKKKTSNVNFKLFDQHYKKNLNNNESTINAKYHTTSDSMKLFSIAAQKFITVQDREGSRSWDDEYELAVNSKRNKDATQHKFVTETVSYGSLKIKSEDINQYLCVKSNGELVFKDSARSKKKKRSRKRCLFQWNFTNQMHVKLYVESRRKNWYLTVKDNKIRMQEESESTEYDRSFIWLPTKSSQQTSPMSRMRNYPDEAVETVCSSLNEQVLKQEKQIKKLKEKVLELEKEVSDVRIINLLKSFNSYEQDIAAEG